MSFEYTGVKVTNGEGGTNYQAKDGTINIVVNVSSEVIQDHGEWLAKEKGSQKYASGDYKIDGDNRIVSVRTTDF